MNDRPSAVTGQRTDRAVDLSRPGWAASPARLAKLKARAEHRSVLRDLAEGRHKRVLLELGHAAHRYREIRNHAGKITQLVSMINLVRKAVKVHASVLVGNAAVVSVPEGFAEQEERIAMIRSESMFDALLMRTVRRATLESECAVRVDIDPAKGTVLCVEENDLCLPVGEDGPDMQPTVYERRWFVERQQATGRKKYLRVERHRLAAELTGDTAAGGVIEQEAYEARDDDAYADLTKLKRVPLAVAVPDNTPADLVFTGLDRNLITRLVTDFDDDGWPEMLMSRGDIDLVDVHAASFSRLARTMEQHGAAKVRIGEQMVGKDGKVNLADDAIIDPDKQFEYIMPGYDFPGMLEWMNQTLRLMLLGLDVSPALLGVKLEGGAMPDTYDKLRLESTNVLIRARTAQRYCEPALETVWWVAGMVDARRPMMGYAVGEVDVALRPEIPADEIDTTRFLAEQMREGLVDEETAVTRLHGDGAAVTILERLRAGRAARAAEAQAAVFGAMGFGGTPSEPAADPVGGAEAGTNANTNAGDAA